MSEYALLLALIVIVSVATVGAIGAKVNDSFHETDDAFAVTAITSVMNPGK